MRAFLALLLLCVPASLSAGTPPQQPVNDVWFEYHIEPTQYYYVPHSAPIYTNVWYEEIILPYYHAPNNTITAIEFYILHNTTHQVKVENISNNLSGWPTTWSRINHQVKFSINEGPFIDRILGVNSFTEDPGHSYTIWCPFDGTMDGRGCSGWMSPKSFKKHPSYYRFTNQLALDWINGPRKPGFSVRVEGRTRFLFQCPEEMWVMQLLDDNSVDLRVRYILE